MSQETKCRNCGSTGVLILDQGSLAPFFMSRVHGIHADSFGYYLDSAILITASSLKNIIGRSLRRLMAINIPMNSLL